MQDTTKEQEVVEETKETAQEAAQEEKASEPVEIGRAHV